MTYKRTKTQSSQIDILLSLLRAIGSNKLYSGLMGSIILSALLSLVLPGAGARRTAENTAFALTGATAAVGIAGSKTGELRSRADKAKALADELAKKMSAQELAAQQQSLVLQARTAALDTQESTYKQRCENASEKRLQRELETGKRKAQAEANKAVRDAQSRLKASEKKLESAIAQHKKILSDAEKHYQTKIDSAAIESQVAIDNLTEDVAKAQQQAEIWRETLARANRELETLKAQQGDVQELLNQKAAQVGRTIFTQQQGVLSEAGTEAEKAIQRTALELQWEKQERIKSNAENMMLKAPKRCLIDSVQGRRANHIQAFIHGLSDKSKNNLGFRMHFVTIAEAGANDIYSFEPCTSRTGTAEDMSKFTHELRQELRCDGLPKIRHNNKTGCIEFVIPQGRVEPISDKDISRLLKSSDAFIRDAAKWQRSRVTGGSESGKSPTSELMAYSIAQQLEADLYFHNPVANSLKAHMSLEQVSSGDDECLAALIQLGTDLEAMSKGQKSRPSKFQFHVFDEIDTLISGNDEAVKAIEIIIKRGSHYGIGIALLGQSDAVTIFKGMTHSDMNNLSQIAIGENARTFIDKMQGVSADDKKKLEDRRVLISDFCNARNKALGLISSGRNQDPQAYRYCAVKAPNQPVTFYTLPEFGSLNPSLEKTRCATTAQPEKTKIGPKTAPLANPGCKNAETVTRQELHQSQPELRSSGLDRADLAQDQDGQICAVTNLRLLDLSKQGVSCPHCGEKSSTYVRKRVRKGDSTVEMKCKTKDCASEGKFRAKVVTD